MELKLGPSVVCTEQKLLSTGGVKSCSKRRRLAHPLYDYMKSHPFEHKLVRNCCNHPPCLCKLVTSLVEVENGAESWTKFSRNEAKIIVYWGCQIMLKATAARTPP